MRRQPCVHLHTQDRSFAFSSHFTREALCERGARCSEMVAHVQFPIYKPVFRLTTWQSRADWKRLLHKCVIAKRVYPNGASSAHHNVDIRTYISFSLARVSLCQRHRIQKCKLCPPRNFQKTFHRLQWCNCPLLRG